MRSTATTGAGTERYVWDTLATVPTLLSDADLLYVYGVGSTPLAQVDTGTGQVNYLHADLIGSVRTTTDADGALTGDADYDPYGTPIDVTADAVAQVTRFEFAGEYTDPTGYLYLRARYYDPATAQFLTRDPLETLTANPYGYTGGNPLQHIDPLGLDWGRQSGAIRMSSGDDMPSCQGFASASLAGGSGGFVGADLIHAGATLQSKAVSQAGRNLANWRWNQQGSALSASRSGQLLSSSQSGAASIWKGMGQSGALRVAGSAVAVGGLAWGGVSEYQESVERGEGTAMAYARAGAGVAGAATGTAAGILASGAIGASVGSVVPLAGTAAGLVVGVVVGAIVSYGTVTVVEASQDEILAW